MVAMLNHVGIVHEPLANRTSEQTFYFFDFLSGDYFFFKSLQVFLSQGSLVSGDFILKVSDSLLSL